MKTGAAELRLYRPEECGLDGYPFAWHESIKQAVKEAAGHRCERCKHPYECGKHGNGEWSPCDDKCVHESDLTDILTVPAGHGHWRILTVHHLDGNKANCEAWNLAALCHGCHLTIQGRVKMDQMLFAELFEVSEWFKPHLDGYQESIKIHQMDAGQRPITEPTTASSALARDGASADERS